VKFINLLLYSYFMILHIMSGIYKFAITT